MTKIHPRHLARNIAHVYFMKNVNSNVNRKFYYNGQVFPSYFSTHWREVIIDEVSK